MIKYNKYTYFWRGPFSQWVKSPFTIEGIVFVCAEQYMMYKKAQMFGDEDTMRRIMSTSSPFVQQLLGREVKNFDVNVWSPVARDIVFRGNMAKYTQDFGYYKLLTATQGTMLVEASPSDKIWGIGLDEETAKITPPEDWPGSNWLGETLTLVRDHLFQGVIFNAGMTFTVDEETNNEV